MYLFENDHGIFEFGFKHSGLSFKYHQSPSGKLQNHHADGFLEAIDSLASDNVCFQHHRGMIID